MIKVIDLLEMRGNLVSVLYNVDGIENVDDVLTILNDAHDYIHRELKRVKKRKKILKTLDKSMKL